MSGVSRRPGTSSIYIVIIVAGKDVNKEDILRRLRVARNQFTRKDFLRLGGASMAGVALLGAAGCGGGGQGGSGGITYSWIPEQTGTLQQMIDRFNQENGEDITVNYREMAADATKHFDQLRTEFQGGGSDIDVIGSDVTWPAQFGENGYYLDLSDRFTEDMRSEFLETPLEANTWQDTPYGVPWYTDAGMLYFRQDLLEESGYSEPPQTWEELKEMASKVQQDQDIRTGFVFQGAEYEGGVCNGLEYIWTHGGDVLDPQDPNNVVVNSPEAAEGLRLQRSLITDGVSPQGVTSYKEQDAQTTFLNGDSVFMRNWPYIYGLAADEDESRVRQEQIGVSTLPVGSEGIKSFSCLGGWNFAINADSQNPGAAWAFIEYMVDPEQEKFFTTETVRIPVIESLLDDQEVLNAVSVIRVGKQAIQNTRPRPVSPFYSDMSLRMAAAFNESLNGEVPPDEALATLQDELLRIVEQTN